MNCMRTDSGLEILRQSLATRVLSVCASNQTPHFSFQLWFQTERGIVHSISGLVERTSYRFD